MRFYVPGAETADAARGDNDRVRAIMARFDRGLGLCACGTRATTLLQGSDGLAHCRRCADQRRDIDRRFRDAEVQTRVLDALAAERSASSRLVGYLRLRDTYRREDGTLEEIGAGAFRDAIRRGALALRIDHDAARVVARQSSGTLDVREDDAGLFLDADVSGTAAGRALLDPSRTFGISFGFREQTSDIEPMRAPRRGRILRRLDVTEISIMVSKQAAYQRSWLTIATLRNRNRAAREALEAAELSL